MPLRRGVGRIGLLALNNVFGALVQLVKGDYFDSLVVAAIQLEARHFLDIDFSVIGQLAQVSNYNYLAGPDRGHLKLKPTVWIVLAMQACKILDRLMSRFLHLRDRATELGRYLIDIGFSVLFGHQQFSIVFLDFGKKKCLDESLCAHHSITAFTTSGEYI